MKERWRELLNYLFSTGRDEIDRAVLAERERCARLVQIHGGAISEWLSREIRRGR